MICSWADFILATIIVGVMTLVLAIGTIFLKPIGAKVYYLNCIPPDNVWPWIGFWHLVKASLQD